MKQDFNKISRNPLNWSTPAKAALCVNLAFCAVSLGMTTIAAHQRHDRVACEAVAAASAPASAPRKCA